MEPTSIDMVHDVMDECYIVSSMVMSNMEPTSILIRLMVSQVNTGELRQLQCILVKNTFNNNFVLCILNVTKVGMLIDNIGIDMSYDFGCYGQRFGGKLWIPQLPKCAFL